MSETTEDGDAASTTGGDTGPARPQPPAMTPDQVAAQPTAMVRVACDGRCGELRDLWADNSAPTDEDGNAFEDPRAALMAAAGCEDDPPRCPGQTGKTQAADTFDAVTPANPDPVAVEVSAWMRLISGDGRSPDLPPVTSAGVALQPLVTVDDLEAARRGETPLPMSTFGVPAAGLLGVLDVDPAALVPAVVDVPPGAGSGSGTDSAGGHSPGDSAGDDVNGADRDDGEP